MKVKFSLRTHRFTPISRIHAPMMVIAAILAMLFLSRVLSTKQASPPLLYATTQQEADPLTSAHPDEGSPNGYGVLLQKKYETWSYVAARSQEDGLIATIHFETHSIAALKAFAAANRELASELALQDGQADVMITFRHQVLPDQFRDWVKANDITVKGTDLREGSGAGRSTASILAEKDDPLPQKYVDQPPRITGGVIDVGGIVDSKRLPQLTSDPLVFLVDVTPSIVRQELTAIGVTDAAEAHISTKAPFWSMEELGLENFKD